MGMTAEQLEVVWGSLTTAVSFGCLSPWLSSSALLCIVWTNRIDPQLVQIVLSLLTNLPECTVRDQCVRTPVSLMISFHHWHHYQWQQQEKSQYFGMWGGGRGQGDPRGLKAWPGWWKSCAVALERELLCSVTWWCLSFRTLTVQNVTWGSIRGVRDVSVYIHVLLLK